MTTEGMFPVLLIALLVHACPSLGGKCLVTRMQPRHVRPFSAAAAAVAEDEARIRLNLASAFGFDLASKQIAAGLEVTLGGRTHMSPFLVNK